MTPRRGRRRPGEAGWCGIDCGSWRCRLPSCSGGGRSLLIPFVCKFVLFADKYRFPIPWAALCCRPVLGGRRRSGIGWRARLNDDASTDLGDCPSRPPMSAGCSFRAVAALPTESARTLRDAYAGTWFGMNDGAAGSLGGGHDGFEEAVKSRESVPPPVIAVRITLSRRSFGDDCTVVGHWAKVGGQRRMLLVEEGPWLPREPKGATATTPPRVKSPLPIRLRPDSGATTGDAECPVVPRSASSRRNRGRGDRERGTGTRVSRRAPCHGGPLHGR